MKTILVMATGLLAVSAKAQNLAADEIIRKTNCTSFECFNEFVTTKGFSYSTSPDFKNATAYLFSSDDFVKSSNRALRTRNTSLIVIYNTGEVSVGFRTADKAYYQKLFSAFKARGFYATSTSKTDNGVATQYSAKQYPNTKLTIVVDSWSKDGQSWTSYDFEVLKM